jgi:hypothetical protein
MARFEVPTAILKDVSLWRLKILFNPENEGSKLL